ncbi:MAG: alpha/beta hydrolase [Oscillospiraceae bacterium]
MKNLSYHKTEMKKVYRAGFTEKDATLPDGTVLHYAYGGDSTKTPLLLIHGQTGCWEDYAPVLPVLALHYHVFAVDCHGHGKSSHTPDKYYAKAMVADFAWFIENIIKRPSVVSGHSSGGLLAAMLAASAADYVIGTVLEDPPFFSTEKGERWEKSFAYVDACEPMHRFLCQTEANDWVLYYIENSAWGKLVGEKGINGMLKYGRSYRKKHPQKALQYFFLPPSVNRMFLFMDSYDLRFGDNFYNSSWFDGYNQREILSRIACPAVLIHTSWSVDENGILMAAMSEDDAKLAHSLMKNSELVNVVSGHGFHFEKPQEFEQIVTLFAERLR